jgi:hypothetical protein
MTVRPPALSLRQISGPLYPKDATTSPQLCFKVIEVSVSGVTENAFSRSIFLFCLGKEVLKRQQRLSAYVVLDPFRVSSRYGRRNANGFQECNYRPVAGFGPGCEFAPGVREKNRTIRLRRYESLALKSLNRPNDCHVGNAQ